MRSSGGTLKEVIKSELGFKENNIKKQEDLYVLPFGAGLMPEILLFGIPHQKIYFNCSLTYSYQLYSVTLRSYEKEQRTKIRVANSSILIPNPSARSINTPGICSPSPGL